MAIASLDTDTTTAALGWLATYLVHSTLWIAGAWIVARWIGSAVWRERLWKGALLGGLASAALVGGLSSSSLTWSWDPARGPAVGEPIVVALGAGSPLPGGLAAAPSEPSPVLEGSTAPAAPAVDRPSGPGLAPVLLGLWLAGAALGLAHLARAHLRMARVLAARRLVAGGPLVERLDRLRATAGLERAVRLSASRALPSPVALARGEIVVPERALERLSERELETLLAHELAHLARRDPAWLLGLDALRRVVWVQPLLGLAAGRALAAAELRCDELAARWTRGELALARCLAEVATWIGDRPAPRLLAGMAERPSALVERVERLLAPPGVPRGQGLLVGSWLAAMLAALSCSGPEVAPADSPGDAESELAVLDEIEILRERMEPEPDQESLEALSALGYVTSDARDRALDEEIAEVEARIREKQEVLDTLKPHHSRYQWLAKEIAELEVQLDQLVLSRRMASGEQGQVETRVGSKLHVTTMTQGGVSMSTASPHVLCLYADGTIDCVTTRLVEPGSRDDAALVEHLTDIAAGMPRAPLSSDRPQGPSLPAGTLRIQIDPDAPHTLLQRALTACAQREVQIWRFSLVPVRDGERGEPLPYALPHELGSGGIEEAVEEGSPAAAEPGPLTISVRVLEPGRTDERGIATSESEGRRLTYSARIVTPLPEQEIGAPPATHTTDLQGFGLDTIRSMLEQAHAEARGRRVMVDAWPGVLHGEVRPVLDALVTVGFTDIVLVGERGR